MPAHSPWPFPLCLEWDRWPAQDPPQWATVIWQGPCCRHHRRPSHLPLSPAVPLPPMGPPRPTQPTGCRCCGPLVWGSMSSPTLGTPKVSPAATCSLCACVCASPRGHHDRARTGVGFLVACALQQHPTGLTLPPLPPGGCPKALRPPPGLRQRKRRRRQKTGQERQDNVSGQKRRGGESLQRSGSFCLQPKPWVILTFNPKARPSAEGAGIICSP